jgi:nitrogen fixation-related uncharacterized protein
MDQQMLLLTIIVVGSMVLFGAGAVVALAWAFRDGQLENFQRGATAIFGPDEPIGEMTDRFPTRPRPGRADDNQTPRGRDHG